MGGRGGAVGIGGTVGLIGAGGVGLVGRGFIIGFGGTIGIPCFRGLCIIVVAEFGCLVAVLEVATLVVTGLISETGLLGGDWNNTLLLGAVVVGLIGGFGKVPKVDAKETGLARTLGGGGHQ